MTWRPGNWEKTKRDACARKGGYFNPDTPIWIKDDLLLFEAGADAMLEALRREGNSKGGRVENDSIRGTGTWLFIPDEEIKS